MGRKEFVALMAMMFATIAFSIDAMLPALPDIAAELSPAAPEQAGLILTAFVLGMGIGTFFTGPLADAYGRRAIIYVGAGLYIVAAGVAWVAQSLELVLIARLVQGLGASGPRVVCTAVIRDLYAGREMAKIMSFVLLVFTLVPAFAPLLGMVIISGFGWRGIFAAFMCFSLISIIWMGMRLPETLPVAKRRPLQSELMKAAVVDMFSHPRVRLSIFAQSMAMGMLFSLLMRVQPIYDEVYGRAESFPYWFGVIALVAGSASVLNAALVGRYGMRRMVTVALGAQVVLSAAMLVFGLSALSEPYGFIAFALWQTCLFFQTGLTLGNLNALAMGPMGHIAGMAASVVGAFATVMAAIIASPVGLLFEGSANSLIFAIMVMAIIGFALMWQMGREEAAPAPVKEPG
ncbi:MAG: multidrug effflux MFS transporter [Pseudomonadota bacterium]